MTTGEHKSALLCRIVYFYVWQGDERRVLEPLNELRGLVPFSFGTESGGIKVVSKLA
jgi:hypothetical protein